MAMTIGKRYWVVKDDVLSSFWVDTRRTLFYDEQKIFPKGDNHFLSLNDMRKGSETDRPHFQIEL
jgi:hypothetical protein